MKNVLFCLALMVASDAWAIAPAEELPLAFAYRSTNGDRNPKVVYLQGTALSKPALLAACGQKGENCACELQDEAGNVLQRSKKLSYEIEGNYFRCEIDREHGGHLKARLFRKRSKQTSAILSVENSVKLESLMHRELNANLVRSIFNYYCHFTYLQKAGTSTYNFDCSNQVQSCGSDKGIPGNFCVLQTSRPFYLYADNFSTTFPLKASDRLYRADIDGRICGTQVKEYDCTGLNGFPQVEFALYNSEVGIWTVPIRLQPSPESPEMTSGFAAKVSPRTHECPPGLVKKAFYQAVTDSRGLGDSNLPQGEVVRQVGEPGVEVAPLTLHQIAGGDCDGRSCVPPRTYSGQVKSLAYTRSEQKEFCVIPREILP